ncbi:MAG: enoyl-CoA hydratase/isomerase family protein [Candidatus Wallbacteria bacterium]|nr:enoyl-CoA hydratase/isomerase family protein [Candidatus Wallbacteria bacterium]
MDYKNILLHVEAPVGTITINRPDKLNALNAAVMTELSGALREMEADDTVRVIVLTGAGEKAFVAGADIAELAKMKPFSGRKDSSFGQEILFQIEQLAKPVVAAINGYALGGGCELALACDVRFASEKAKIGLPEVTLGIIPGYGGTQRLGRIVGKGRAMELVLSGEPIDAAEAYRIGLVNKVAPPAELAKTVREWAEKLAARGPLALRLAKAAVQKSLEVDLRDGCELESAYFGMLASTADMREGMTAFLEKRKPVYKGE